MNSIDTSSTPVRLRRFFFIALAAFSTFVPALAQADDEADADILPPPRLAVVEGPVQYWRPGADGWVSAPLNAALAEGDAIHGGDSATAELQIAPRDFVRLTGETMLTLVTHDPGLMQFRVDSGTASFDLRGSRSSQLIQIDAPNVSIVAGGRGYYRVFARDGETRLTVRQGGRATLNLPSGRSRSVTAGQEVIIHGSDATRVEVFPAPPLDAWDRWNDARSDYYAAAASNRYVPADVYGAADLDQYGRWREDGTYGWIWVPGVASGWAPYSAGSWHWDPVYGWTWVDNAPWGWTTHHYGRWVHVDGYWAWAPGPRGVRVTYAPALVTFIGSGSGIGWVALGWGEPLLPWWGRPGFRGQPWWGGWGGPRTHYRDDHRYRNRDVGNAFITGRDHDFDRHRGRGATLPPVNRGDSGKPWSGDRSNRNDWRRDRPDAGPDHRPDRQPEPIIATPQRGPGVNPQYRQEPTPARTRERRELPPTQLRPAPIVESPREQRPVEHAVPRFEPRPTVAEPPQARERPAPQQRDSRFDDRNRRESPVEQPRFMPRGAEQRPQESRQSPGGRSGNMRLPGDRN